MDVRGNEFESGFKAAVMHVRPIRQAVILAAMKSLYSSGG
jgi:hypothetical protein